jgi:hypothetical protein
LYEADIVVKFWLPMGGIGHCRTPKGDSVKTDEIPNEFKTLVVKSEQIGTNSTFF